LVIFTKLKITTLPELPEVQTTVNGINKKLKGLRIVDIWTDYPARHYDNPQWQNSEKISSRQIKNKHFFNYFKKNIVGKKITGAERRAKNVLIHLSANKTPSKTTKGRCETILIHMKMTGHLLFGKYEKVNTKTKNLKPKTTKWVAQEPGPLRDDSFNQFIHLVFSLSNGKHLVLSDMRKFAKVLLIENFGLNTSSELSHLGPEPLTSNFSLKVLKERLNKKPNWPIKSALMDQTLISGIGNIYSDEILWASNIHPLRKVEDLKTSQFIKILVNTKLILKKGIDFKGDSMSDYRNIDGRRGRFQNEHQAYRRTGKPCTKKRCPGTIKRTGVRGRNAHFCSTHQK